MNILNWELRIVHALFSRELFSSMVESWAGREGRTELREIGW